MYWLSDVNQNNFAEFGRRKFKLGSSRRQNRRAMRRGQIFANTAIGLSIAGTLAVPLGVNYLLHKKKSGV